MKKTTSPALALLASAEKIFGSRRQLARRIGRDERTLRRWSEGTLPVPEAVQVLLEDLVSAHAQSQPTETR